MSSGAYRADTSGKGGDIGRASRLLFACYPPSRRSAAAARRSTLP